MTPISLQFYLIFPPPTPNPHTHTQKYTKKNKKKPKKKKKKKKKKGFTHTLLVTFTDEMALKAYDTAPTHLELGKLIIPFMKEAICTDTLIDTYPEWGGKREKREKGGRGREINNKSQAKWP